jgi:hypothetical protein
MSLRSAGRTGEVGAGTRLRSCALWLGLAAIALAALPAGAQEQRAESVGVAPITGRDSVPRDTALRAAVQGAVVSAAAAMLPASFTPPEPAPEDAPGEPNAWLAERLGDDPFVYVTRFRILEDRGRRPAMFAADRDVEFEYVVVAEVNLDLDAIRARMEKLGFVASVQRASGRQVILVLEGLSSYQPVAIVRKALASDRGVRSVVPVEFTERRAVLAVDADRGVGRLVEDLTRRAPEGLRIVTVDQGPASATLLVEWQPPAPAPASDGAAGRPARSEAKPSGDRTETIDTHQ